MKICICGGGNLGHVTAGFIAAKGQDEVSILTRNPERWANTLAIDTPGGTALKGHISRISAAPGDVIPGADLIILCLPGFSIASELRLIAPHLQAGTAVGSVVSSTGFYFEALRQLPHGTPLFGFQRVPFIARTAEYGHRASLLGFRKQINMAAENVEDTGQLRLDMERMLSTPVAMMKNMYEVSLTNSNPLLHTSRLYSLWSGWNEGQTADRVPMFYEEWTDHAAELYIAMDREFQRLLRMLPVTPGCIPDVLTYYESTDAPTLAAKLRSIEAFKGIPSPMRKVAGGYVPDFGSRYFTEDFPFGLAIVHRLMREKGLPSPNIDKVYEWGKNQTKATATT